VSDALTPGRRLSTLLAGLRRRHPRHRQRRPAADGHPGRAAGHPAGHRCADRPGRAGWCAPARPQAFDPGPHPDGWWGLHRRRGAPRGAMTPVGMRGPTAGLSQQVGCEALR
jgi:hypothetical protein